MVDPQGRDSALSDCNSSRIDTSLRPERDSGALYHKLISPHTSASSPVPARTATIHAPWELQPPWPPVQALPTAADHSGCRPVFTWPPASFCSWYILARLRTATFVAQRRSITAAVGKAQIRPTPEAIIDVIFVSMMQSLCCGFSRPG